MIAVGVFADSRKECELQSASFGAEVVFTLLPLLDDDNRKPICRLHFNSTHKYIELFHNGKDKGEKRLLASLEEIYPFRTELLATVGNY